jgi:hypothetical protein
MHAANRAAALARRTRSRAADTRTWTARQISEALSSAAELVRTDGGLAAGEREADLIGLVVNAALTLLEQPAVSLDEVMDACYEGGAAQVRSWWHGWT